MKKLLVWGYALQSMDKAEKWGCHGVSSGAVVYQRSLTLRKRILILTFRGVGL